MRRSDLRFSRREFLFSAVGAGLSAPSLLGASAPPGTPQPLKSEDRAFLEDCAKRCVRYFWEQADPRTGIVLDRARNDGARSGDNVGSIAATGFGLTALCIGASRGWLPRDQVRARILTTLRYFWMHAFHDHGWYYHFLDASSGARRLGSEISSVDSAFFLCGILTASGYFSGDKEIHALAKQIFDRVDFAWMLGGNPLLLSMGVRPGSGFLKSRWSVYSEASVLYLLAIGASRHAIPSDSWYAWLRPEVHYQNWSFVSGGPLFTHQFSHAWVDFRHQQDGDPSYLNYFQNSISATYAHRDFCVSLQSQYSDYASNMWGITASDSPSGYVVWGDLPPYTGPINGTLVPCAAAGSLMFAQEICLPVLREMRNVYGDKIYQRYGFTDAFNPNWRDRTLWVNQDVVGIDVGISLLSISNLLAGDVWHWFMKNEYIRSAMERVGFRLATPGITIRQAHTGARQG
ncbi:MAG TPA: glucoamylase family protein [Bryobacteraceae bacterium]|nr:glucoamylase family protein [Bryobacteraceae bacterium]